ncbi:MAG: allantoate amidohydrolase [Herminiimonas sp.]|nr:allantoate amidohydrolase [Herminiimonas sp.]
MRLDTSIAQEIMRRIAALACYTEQAGMLTRTYLSDAHQGAAVEIAAWMKQAGMVVRRDAAGNVIGRYEGLDPTAAALATGSHFDTVRNGGHYDGPLGIVLPISCIAAWSQQGCRFPFAIEVMAFSEEEGVRFKATLLGSRAIAGTFDTGVLDNVDDAGKTMRGTMLAAGFDPADLPAAAYRAEQLAGFVEVHIEQGPVLLDEGLALGVVTAISGATRFMVDIKGSAGHAGTVPMALRHDAAMAAAEIALYIEGRCASVPGVVGTVGQLTVPNGAVNVIPGAAQMSIDMRAGDDALRTQATADVMAEIDRICLRRGVDVTVRKTYDASSVACSGALQQQWAETLTRCGLAARHLVSGAGHDTMAMATVTDAAMLFVRCGNGGISHHPDESMTADDAALAAAAFMDFVVHFRAPAAFRAEGR